MGLPRTEKVRLSALAPLDVCTTADRGWIVLECNPCWGSGIYGCDPHRVLPVIARACVPNENRHLEDPRCFPQRG